MSSIVEDFESCYRLSESRDPRYDGIFFIAATSTRLYCRPSCPARQPKRANVRFYPTAAAAQSAGFRACKRCRPDAAPGSPDWNWRADRVARAMRLIADGTVDREGVPGLARRLGFSERHLRRLLAEQVGATPVALARAQRANTARLLIESTAMPFADAAFAAGFHSVRQFNDTIRDVFASTPSEMRRRSKGSRPRPLGVAELRLSCREPFDGDALLRFLEVRAVPGLEEVSGDTYRRALTLTHGAGIVELTPEARAVRCILRLDDLRDLGTAVARCRRLLDLDADPLAIAEALGRDEVIGGLVRARPGPASARLRRRRRARPARGARSARVAEGSTDTNGPSRRDVRYAAGAAARNGDTSCSRPRRSSPKPTRRRLPGWAHAAKRCRHSPPDSPTVKCASTAAQTRRKRSLGYSRFLALDPGPPRTSRCGDFTIPMRSRMATLAFAGR